MTSNLPIVQRILKHYDGENPGVKANLYRLMTHGALAHTGKMIILPVDQGFEHGPGRSFAMNPAAYDPHYHFELAVEGGVSAYAAPLGMLEAGADTFAGQVPLILKMNSSNSLISQTDQAITASVEDALRLGCSAIGFTIYPGADESLEMYEELQAITEQAKACGLAVIVWAYARGNMSSEGETGLDTISYGAHMACLLGANIVKVKLPSAFLENKHAKPVYEDNHVPKADLEDRVRHVVQCCFNARRMVIFSGGGTKSDADVLKDAKAIAAGGGNGSIIGRNMFQRPKAEALKLLKGMVDIYKDA